jgi:hypothetical protein
MRLYSSPDVREEVTHAAQAVAHVKIAPCQEVALLPAPRRWRLIDRLGEQIILDLMHESLTGAPRQVLAERYGISLSSVKRLLHKYRT